MSSEIIFQIAQYISFSEHHTYCTNLILAGVAPVTVKDLMGHASIRITLDIYTHITEEFKENDMNKYNDFLKNIVNNCEQTENAKYAI